MSTSSQNRKIFLVCGATGAQGGSVVRALLKSGKYTIRGITRDLNSEKAKSLKNQGVEMMECDFTKQQELKNVLKGVEIMFAVTNFWDPQTMGKECEIGKGIVDCAKECGVKHFIWSTLPNVEKYSGGKLNVPHFTDKAKVGEYALKTLPTTLISPAFYFQNFTTNFLHQKKESDGTIVFTLPKITHLAALDINDIGEAVMNIAENRNEMTGKFIPLAGDNMPMQQYMDLMQEICGMRVKLNAVSFKDYAKLNFEGAQELADMFEWIESSGYFGPNSDISMGKKVCPHLKNFRDYLQSWKVNPK